MQEKGMNKKDKQKEYIKQDQKGRKHKAEVNLFDNEVDLSNQIIKQITVDKKDNFEMIMLKIRRYRLIKLWDIAVEKSECKEKLIVLDIKLASNRIQIQNMKVEIPIRSQYIID